MTTYQKELVWKRRVRKFVISFKAIRRDNGEHVIVRTGSYGRSWKAAVRWIRLRYSEMYIHIGRVFNTYPHDNCTNYGRIKFPKPTFPPNTFITPKN